MFGLDYSEDSDYNNSHFFPIRKKEKVEKVTSEEFIDEKGNKRILYKISVGSISGKKWWQFWKKDYNRKAKEDLSKLISDYSKDINIDEKTGIIIPQQDINNWSKNNDDNLNEQK